MKEKQKELQEANTYLNSLQFSSQVAKQTSVTPQGQMMVVESEQEQLQKDLAELEKTSAGGKLELDKQSE